MDAVKLEGGISAVYMSLRTISVKECISLWVLPSRMELNNHIFGMPNLFGATRQIKTTTPILGVETIGVQALGVQALGVQAMSVQAIGVQAS